MERRENCDKHIERTDELEKVIYKGNGSPAILVDIATIKVTNKVIVGLQMLTISAIIKLIFFGA